MTFIKNFLYTYVWIIFSAIGIFDKEICDSNRVTTIENGVLNAGSS